MSQYTKKLFLTGAVLFVLFSYFFVGSVEASSEMWSRTYGGEEGDYASSVIETSDGGYALAGITRDDYGFDVNGWLVKTDAYGNMEWNRTYGGEDNWHIECLVQSSDEGYVIAGDKYVFDEGYDCWLAKTDAQGNIEWSRIYGGTSPDHASSVVETSDGGYALAGETHSFGAGGYDCWLVKTDGYGNVEWNRTYGGANHEHAYSMIQTSDGGFAMAGTTYDSPFSEQRFFLLVKTDASGNMEWNQTYGGEGFDIAYSLVETSDGGFALAGSQLVKTDENGNIEWIQTYGAGRFNSLVKTSDGGYTLAGWTGPLDIFGKTEFWLIKTDEHGIIPEFPSWIILPLFLMATFSAIILKKRLFHQRS